MSTAVLPHVAQRATAVPGAPSSPQVNLLPPEIRAGRQLGRLKSWLGVAILVTVLVAGLMFVFGVWSAKQAEAELADVQDTNQQLVADQAQYAEVPRVLKQLTEVKDARTLGMSTEVMWRPYLAAIAATAPAGVSLDTFAVVAVTPTTTQSVVGSADPLQQPNVGTVTFGGRSLTLPDTADWMDGLAGVPGFADPWFTSAQVTEEDGSVYFQINGTVQLTEAAYADRFVPETDEEAS